jgi:hypothetical protein
MSLAAFSCWEFEYLQHMCFGTSNGGNDGCLSDSSIGNGQQSFQSFFRTSETYSLH